MHALIRSASAVALFSLLANSHAADTAPTKATVPRFDHVLIVIMENEDQERIIGNPEAPYINSLARAGANFTDAHAVTHPSQPNYLALFSGSTQGVTDNSCPLTFTGRANLASQLVAAGLTFTGFSEDLPAPGYSGCAAAEYRRKHNPWVNFDNVNSSSNQPFTAFPSGNFAALPTVSVVVPNMCNDNHDCPTATGDSWLKTKLDAYVQWAKTNNSLLVLTWDESGSRTHNHIATILVGAKVKPGNYGMTINHYNVLRTVQEMYGLAPLGNTASAPPIIGIWTTQ